MIDEYGNEQTVGSKEFEEYLHYRMDKEFCNDISCGDMAVDNAVQYANEFFGYALDLQAEVKRLREELKHLNDIKDGINMALKAEDALFNIMIEIESILHKNRWIEYDCHECGRKWTRNNGRGCPYGDPTCFLCDKHDHNNCDDPRKACDLCNESSCERTECPEEECTHPDLWEKESEEE